MSINPNSNAYEVGYKVGYAEALSEICSVLGLSKHHYKNFILDFIKSILSQATAWQSMNHITDNTVEPLIAANKLVREIEQVRSKNLNEFETWFNEYWKSLSPVPVMNEAFKEVAGNAWNAALSQLTRKIVDEMKNFPSEKK